jgi:hypothetical protein
MKCEKTARVAPPFVDDRSLPPATSRLRLSTIDGSRRTGYANEMRVRRKKLVFLLTIWLTVPSTLFASSPRIECTCPDGTKKPFCISTVFGGSDCCCQGTCCSETERPSAPSAPGCCCCKRSRPAATGRKTPPVGRVQTTSGVRKASTGETSIQRRGCAKSLAMACSYVAEQSPTPIAGIHVAAWSCASAMLSTSEEVFASCGATRRQSTDALPAPPNLVIVLCHFMI